MWDLTVQSRGSTAAGMYSTAAPPLLLFSTFWHGLHCFDPLLSFFSCSSLEEVVSLIWGDDLKEVAVNVVFFGWKREKMRERELKGMKLLTVNTNYISWSQSVAVGKRQWVCILWQLTIRHILHSCNHRPTEMDGAQRVIALTKKERWQKKAQGWSKKDYVSIKNSDFSLDKSAYLPW